MIIKFNEFKISMLDLDTSINHMNFINYDLDFSLVRRVSFVSSEDSFEISFKRSDIGNCNLFTPEQIKSSYKRSMIKFINYIRIVCEEIIKGNDKENFIYTPRVLNQARNEVINSINSLENVDLSSIVSHVSILQGCFTNFIRHGS